MIAKKLFLLLTVFSVGFFGLAYGHTVDSVGEYRLEIGWMNEPVVSGETNGIEIFVSPMEPGLELEDQVFKDGITGLEDTMKMQLVFKEQKIMLPFSADHNIAGKYYAFVDPTSPGFYQANILGTIKDTTVSLSMHPPKVHDRTYIEFPEKEKDTEQQLLEEHTSIQEQHANLQKQIDEIKGQSSGIAFAGIGLGIAGIVIASIAISKIKK